ncbi:TIGR04338 family metallohydrolase [Rhodococcus rhodnii]|uniref:TIGR04338 family metallohydrolase n=2 Tax=Rhodococcus rhodnii TaxID=38312 RepID=R7WNF8_9NOCA|nr:TIGR04338 family metallohydrolase [Rhodococcus rhodnii]EOM76846.1 hypothetical protein Rrhod_1759 [Rhodococcus rhodnii LMG 5362]TXG89785.1 TIGR04338 family metallohydrolase [Rhodococcus rhodnii]
MTRVRDRQRSLVYDAEELVRTMFDRADQRGMRTVEMLGSTLTLPIERRFGSIDSVQAYADAVLGLRWIRARWPRASDPVRVRARKGAAAAHYERDGGVIAVPGYSGGTAWAMRELVVLHELAHHLDPAPDAGEAHGPGFTAIVLELVAEIIGHEAGFVLRAMYAENGVRVG